MITEKDLLEAIAECQGERNPNANTCIKLAAYYTILDHLDDKNKIDQIPIEPINYYSSENKDGILYIGESEFANSIYGKDINQVLSIVDELMTTLQVINPRLYNGVMRKIAE